MKISIKSLIIILALTLVFASCLFNNNTPNMDEPILGEGSQSECHDLTKLNEEEWVEFLINGNSFTINHYDAYRNCGMEVDFQMEFDMPIIIVREYDVGMPADCMCYLDFSVTLSEMEPGDYNIELWAGDDYLIAEEDVTIE